MSTTTATHATDVFAGHNADQVKMMEEVCITVNPNDKPISKDEKGWVLPTDKKGCHLMENIDKGLLHRAFSVFLFHPENGKLLLQQRASEKITFPDLWTNTCCSHPLASEPGESNNIEGVCIAATRKLEQELGISPKEVPPNQFQYLSKIHYLAPSNEPWGEHEIDYILFITAFVKVNPNPIEIRDYKYVTKEELQAMFDDPQNSFTPWFKLIARDFLFGWWDDLMATSQVDPKYPEAPPRINAQRLREPTVEKPNVIIDMTKTPAVRRTT